MADFGAARAQTPEATQLLQSSINILSVEKLRNGDWKEEVNEGNGIIGTASTCVAVGASGGTTGITAGSGSGGDGSNGIATADGSTSVATEQEHGLGEDQRLEGTPAYLPPEV